MIPNIDPAIIERCQDGDEQAFEEVFGILAQLGVVALLFRVGLRSHTRALLSKLPRASIIWLGDVLTNLAIGFVLARYGLGLPLEAALLVV